MNKASNPASPERNLLSSALDKLEDFLSEKGFHLDRSTLRFDREAEPADARVRFKGKQVSLFLYAKPRLFESHINRISADKLALTRGVAVLVTSEVTPRIFDHCRDAGISVIDLQGNIQLELPGIYIERYRESRRPRKPSVSGSVFTARASRLVRSLLAEYPKVWSQSELAETTEVSAGYVSTRVRLLEKEGYVVSTSGRITLVDPNRLLDDWAARYRFDRHRRHRYAVSIASYEQGLRKIQNELQRNHIRFAWTGWSAAQLVAPYVRTEMFMAYVEMAHQTPVFRALQPVEDGGNVILLEPHDEGVFQFNDSSFMFGSLVCAPQLYIDLRNMSGRAPEQAEAVREKKLRFESQTNA